MILKINDNGTIKIFEPPSKLDCGLKRGESWEDTKYILA